MERVDPTKDPSDAKLRELILFISKRSSCDERFGSTKLNKLLFFSDFLAFARLGSSITGHAYFRLPNGPAPKRMIPIVETMVGKQELAFASNDYHGQIQKVPLALRDADLSLFTADEIAVVTEVLESHWRNNARGISTKSHKFPGWKLAREKEVIPYELALVHFRKPRKKDLEKVLNKIDEVVKLRDNL